MRVNKAKRRWLKWARYVVSTGTQTAKVFHNGHSKAYMDVYCAGRAVGDRQPYYPRWMWDR